MQLQQLQQHLQQETALVSKFIVLLEQEAEVLAGGADHDALTPVITKKNAYAEKLQDQATQRNACLTSMGYGTDKEGLEAAVSDHLELMEPVNRLLEGTARASILNTGNGRIITRFLTHTQQGLDVLQHLTGRSDLYDATGRKRPMSRPKATHIKVT